MGRFNVCMADGNVIFFYINIFNICTSNKKKKIKIPLKKVDIIVKIVDAITLSATVVGSGAFFYVQYTIHC